MSRSDQIVGLNSWAEAFVAKDGVLKEDSLERFDGMLGQEYPLHKYTFPDGRVYFEKVQADPWSSGPVFFIALKNDKGNWIPKSLWTREEINSC